MSKRILLTQLREAKKLTRARLGYRAEVHAARVGAIELGRVVPGPDSVELIRLARALGYEGAPAGLLAVVDDGRR